MVGGMERGAGNSKIHLTLSLPGLPALLWAGLVWLDPVLVGLEPGGLHELGLECPLSELGPCSEAGEVYSVEQTRK